MPAAKKHTRSPATSGSKATPKVQGEGDYESARKYNERTRAFVKKMANGMVPGSTGTKAKDAKVSEADLKAAEKAALARSRGRAGDKADARIMTANIAANTTNSRRG